MVNNLNFKIKVMRLSDQSTFKEIKLKNNMKSNVIKSMNNVINYFKNYTPHDMLSPNEYDRKVDRAKYNFNKAMDLLKELED